MNTGIRHKTGLFWPEFCEVGLWEPKINAEDNLYWSYSIEFTKDSRVWWMFFVLDQWAFKWQWMGLGWVHLWLSWPVAQCRCPCMRSNEASSLNHSVWVRWPGFTFWSCCLLCALNKLFNLSELVTNHSLLRWLNKWSFYNMART